MADDEERRRLMRDATNGDASAADALELASKRVSSDFWSGQPGLMWATDDAGLARSKSENCGATMSLRRGDLVLVDLLHKRPYVGRFLATVEEVPTGKWKPKAEETRYGQKVPSKVPGVPCALVLPVDLLLADPVSDDKALNATARRSVCPNGQVRVFADDHVLVVRRAGKAVEP